MQSPTQPSNQATSLIRSWFPVIGGGSGLIALWGFLAAFLFLPTRVEKVEEVNKAQSVEIVELRNDATQRREVLAAAVATLTQINDRTRRIEDHLLQEHKK